MKQFYVTEPLTLFLNKFMTTKNKLSVSRKKGNRVIHDDDQKEFDELMKTETPIVQDWKRGKIYFFKNRTFVSP